MEVPEFGTSTEFKVGRARMTPLEVQSLIAEQLRQGFRGDPTCAGSHGVDLLRCLLPAPERRAFLDSFDDYRPKEMWLVLEEDPVRHAGYQIVFDDSRGQFGLAVPGSGAAVFIGYYGSFVDTLEGM